MRRIVPGSCWRALRRAHAVHPIAAVQSEYSLCTRNPEIAVIEACRGLQADLIASLDSLIKQRSVTGERYNAAALAEVDTENFSSPP